MVDLSTKKNYQQQITRLAKKWLGASSEPRVAAWERDGGENSMQNNSPEVAANKNDWLNNIAAPATIVNIKRETHQTVTLTIKRDDKQNIEFEPGQYIVLYIYLGATLYRRPYSISSIHSVTDEVEITVKQIFDGLISGFFNHECEEGQKVYISGVEGDFLFNGIDPQTQAIVYIAAGSGITPIKPLLHQQLSHTTYGNYKTALLYSSRQEKDFIFLPWLQALNNDKEALSLRLVATRDQQSEFYLNQRMDFDWITSWLQEQQIDFAHTHFFICGPRDFTDNFKRQLNAAQGHANNISCELFVAASGVQQVPLQPQPVTIKRQGLFKKDKTFYTNAGESIWQAAKRNKIQIPTNCRVGGCRTCMVKLSSGQVVMDEPNCLSPRELKDYKLLSCVAYPIEPVTIEFID